MVGTPLVELMVKTGDVVEVAIAAVEEHGRGRDSGEQRTRSDFDDLRALRRHDDDKLVSQTRRPPQLGVDVGPDPSAPRTVECADVDDPHITRSDEMKMQLNCSGGTASELLFSFLAPAMQPQGCR